MREGGTANSTSGIAGKDQSLLNLVKSSLWEENAYCHGHQSVWGSWYDVESKCWGYACCRSAKRDERCSKSSEGPSQKKRSKIMLPDEQVYDWGKPPLELLPKEKVTLTASLLNSKSDHQGCFITHFVRYIIGGWRRMLGGQMSDETAPRDWICPKCKDLQFARNLRCRQCGTANPDPEKKLSGSEKKLPPGVKEIERNCKFEAVDWFSHREEAGAKAKVIQVTNVMPSDFPEDLKGVQSCEEAEKGIAPFLRQLQMNKADPRFVEQVDKVVSLAADQEYLGSGKAYKETSALKIDDASSMNEVCTQKVLQSLHKIVRLAEAMHPSSDHGNKFSSDETT